jgi:integrase
MARALNQLSARTVAVITKPGRHADGGGLYLNVAPAGTKSWLFMFKAQGKRTELGLGSLISVPLAEARRKAQIAREAIGRGDDPRAALKPKTAGPSFGQCADDLIASMEGAWRNPKHRQQWRTTLSGEYEAKRIRGDRKSHETHQTALRRLRATPVDQVGTDHVLAVLSPIWSELPETASRIRGRIEAVLSAAKAKGYRTGENPAQWRGHLDRLLPRPEKLSARGHMAALPYAELPDFMSRLRERESVSRLALEFAILTAARSGEVRGARWSEIDRQEKIWTIPPERMKAGKAHRVPLSDRAIELLDRMEIIASSELIFPGGRSEKPLSDAILSKVAKELGGSITAHGFRSTFRDWAGDETSFPREVAEAALAHSISDKVEAAYRRSDALDKRRNLMDAWSIFCTALTAKSGDTI